MFEIFMENSPRKCKTANSKIGRACNDRVDVACCDCTCMAFSDRCSNRGYARDTLVLSGLFSCQETRFYL